MPGKANGAQGTAVTWLACHPTTWPVRYGML
jgi:hypothetical protein